MENKRFYWAIVVNEVVVFNGTHEQCWNKLYALYPDVTVRELVFAKVSISRIK